MQGCVCSHPLEPPEPSSPGVKQKQVARCVAVHTSTVSAFAETRTAFSKLRFPKHGAAFFKCIFRRRAMRFSKCDLAFRRCVSGECFTRGHRRTDSPSHSPPSPTPSAPGPAGRPARLLPVLVGLLNILSPPQLQAGRCARVGHGRRLPSTCQQGTTCSALRGVSAGHWLCRTGVEGCGLHGLSVSGQPRCRAEEEGPAAKVLPNLATHI